MKSYIQYRIKSLYITKLLIIQIGFFILFTILVPARDFYEPLCIHDHLTIKTGELFVLIPSGYGEFKYTNYLFQGSDQDAFYFGVSGSYTAINLFDIFAAGGYYSCYNLIGPFKEGDPVVNIGRWWMNAVEFEYGITGSINIFGFHLILEYARTSQHPFRSMFSEVSTDNLKTGIVFPELTIDNLTINYYIRAGLVDLFDFWESVLPKPRVEWVITPNFRAIYLINQDINLFLLMYLELNFLRDSGMDTSIYLETGVSLGKSISRMQLFLEYYQTPDTEELLYEAAPVALLGLGIRGAIGP